MKAARERREVRAPDRDGAKDPAYGELGPEEIWKEPVKRLLIRLGSPLLHDALARRAQIRSQPGREQRVQFIWNFYIWRG
jgi:hypothetical protein